jgi:ketopantoate reductase
MASPARRPASDVSRVMSNDTQLGHAKVSMTQDRCLGRRAEP